MLAQAIKAWALVTTATATATAMAMATATATAMAMATRNSSDPKISLSMISAEAGLPPSL